MKKPSIPSISSVEQSLARILEPLKANVEILTGTRGGEIAPLAEDATTADMIEAINTLIARLNASGT